MTKATLEGTVKLMPTHPTHDICEGLTRHSHVTTRKSVSALSSHPKRNDEESSQKGVTVAKQPWTGESTEPNPRPTKGGTVIGMMTNYFAVVNMPNLNPMIRPISYVLHQLHTPAVLRIGHEIFQQGISTFSIL